MTSRSGTPDIMTVSGRFMEFLDPKWDQICMEDIAHALSQTCRFAAQTKVFYSVAEHCIRVSDIVRAEFRKHALLHDASEAYMCDLPSPLKKLLPEYKAIETRLQSRIFVRFGLNPEMPPEVKGADQVLLATEGRDLCHESWQWVGLPFKPLEQIIKPMTPEQAERAFMSIARGLFGTDIT